MKMLMTTGVATVLAMATAAPSFAQYYQPTPDSQQQYQQYQDQRSDYEARRQQYENSRQNYESSRQTYENSRGNYQVARSDYERRLADWERARAAYDARWGYGAYARRYPRPVWDQAYGVAPAPYAGAYGYNASANVRCDTTGSTVGAGALGAIAGAILGSQVSGHGARTEGSVLGAVVGGGIGAAIGNANAKYKCDNRGPYFTYNETRPYRESRAWRYGSNDYSYYQRMRCRLAPAPVDEYGRDYRYVRVCPDESGRYRITG
jgi:hypothetical protein